MAPFTAPSTPEQSTPRKMAMNRSFTVPSKLAAMTRIPTTPAIGAAEGIEVLYVHPRANIIKFSTSGPASRPSSSSGSPGSGTLRWASPSERTLAAGPLEIYRVPGSVSFLHSGDLLHAILPRGQCWCVDGVSKFAMRVLPDTYYRIELPGESAEDLEQVEALRVTLKKVLFFERTPCPFARTFNVELPEEEIKVKHGRRKSSGPAKKWRLEKAYSWRPDGWEEPSRGASDDSSQGASEESEQNSDAEEDRLGATEDVAETGRKLDDTPSKPPRSITTMRSITSPAQLSTHLTSARLNLRFGVNVPDPGDSRLVEQTLEDQGTRSLQTIPTDMPPSPPDSSAGLDLRDSTSALDDVETSKHALSPEPSATESNDRAMNPTKDLERIDPPAGAQDEHIKLVETPVIGEETDTSQGAGVDGIALMDTTTHDEKLDILDGVQSEHTKLPGSSSIDGKIDTLENANSDAINLMGTSTNDDEIGILDGTQDDDADLVEPTTFDEQSAVLEGEQSGDSSRNQASEADDIPRAMSSEQETPDPMQTSSTQTAPEPEQIKTQAKDSLDFAALPEDPFAAIQARILARRSIGGTTTFRPSARSPTRHSSSSTSSTATISSSRSYPSSRSNQQNLAGALVSKAYAVFLGPPAHLVAIMLRIAARYADGTFTGSVFFVESPVGAARRVPGSFNLDDERIGDELGDWEADDFGVPLRSPVRLATRGGSEGLREREARGWHLD